MKLNQTTTRENMKYTEIKPAIAESSLRNEIVTLETDDPKGALEAIDNDENVTELDYTDDQRDGVSGYDVWGKRIGSDFRLWIPKAAKTAKRARKPFARKTSAIAGYYIVRVGKRVVLSEGQVGAWVTISTNASRSQISNAGFNLDNPEVAEVAKYAR